MKRMAPRRLDAEIDRLYQLPPDAFTAARNALAKGAGAGAAEIRQLARPPLAAWAVNQVYWQQRDLCQRLIAAAKELRQSHKAVLSGRSGDLRAAGKAHDAAVEAAAKAALSLLSAAGQKATDATRQAIATTLRALPGEEPPGRLSKTLQPGGFEMLAGLTVGGKRGAARPPDVAARPAPASKRQQEPDPRTGATKSHAKIGRPDAAAREREAQAKAAAREAAAAAARAVREAEHVARREEFEAARSVREVERAERRLAQAREAVAQASEALAEATREAEEAEAAATDAGRVRTRAEERAEAAAQVLAAAKARGSGLLPET